MNIIAIIETPNGFFAEALGTDGRWYDFWTHGRPMNQRGVELLRHRNPDATFRLCRCREDIAELRAEFESPSTWPALQQRDIT